MGPQYKLEAQASVFGADKKHTYLHSVLVSTTATCHHVSSRVITCHHVSSRVGRRVATTASSELRATKPTRWRFELIALTTRNNQADSPGCFATSGCRRHRRRRSKRTSARNRTENRPTAARRTSTQRQQVNRCNKTHLLAQRACVSGNCDVCRGRWRQIVRAVRLGEHQSMKIRW